MPYARVEAAVFTTMYGTQEAEWPAAGGGAEEGAGRPVTAAEVEDIVRRVLAGTTLYVLESDITQAQNAVKVLENEAMQRAGEAGQAADAALRSDAERTCTAIRQQAVQRMDTAVRAIVEKVVKR